MPESPNPDRKQPYRSNASYLMQYVSLGFQLLAILGISLYGGMKLDNWLHLSVPLLVWLLPLLILIGMFYNILKETQRKKQQ